MSVKSQVKAAEEALRQALINALAEGEDQWIADLFASYQAVGDLNRKVNATPNYSFNLTSDYLRPGGDLDNLDNVLDFTNANNISINTNTDDTITFS